MENDTFVCSNCGRTLPSACQASRHPHMTADDDTGICWTCFECSHLPEECAAVASAFADQRAVDWEEAHPGAVEFDYRAGCVDSRNSVRHHVLPHPSRGRRSGDGRRARGGRDRWQLSAALLCGRCTG